MQSAEEEEEHAEEHKGREFGYSSHMVPGLVVVVDAEVEDNGRQHVGVAEDSWVAAVRMVVGPK
jgi:hypothetical protein